MSLLLSNNNIVGASFIFGRNKVKFGTLREKWIGTPHFTLFCLKMKGTNNIITDVVETEVWTFILKLASKKWRASHARRTSTPQQTTSNVSRQNFTLTGSVIWKNQKDFVLIPLIRIAHADANSKLSFKQKWNLLILCYQKRMLLFVVV